MFQITVQASEKARSRTELYKLDKLADLIPAFATCEQGGKLGSGLIRGALTKPERCNENLEYSKLLIIDADGGANGNVTPDPQICHSALIELGYSHIIYTTHSHTAEYPKYRALVELTEEIQEHELHYNMEQLIDELKAQGCSLKYAHEMDTWSQTWFLPRRDDPTDGLYRLLTWMDGDCFPTIHVEKSEADERKREVTTSEDDAKTETLDAMMENIRTGKEYHHSLRNLSYQLAKDGVSKAIIKSMLTSAMESSKDAGSQRWEQRMKDLERLIDGGVKRVQDEVNVDFDLPEQLTQEANYTPPPIPPGRLGRAIKQCLECMPRPQLEFAFPMILGSVAAICGARFNAHTNEFSGLNLNMTIVADTGFGKGQISKFYNNLFIGGLDGNIVNLSGGDGALSFIGTNNYTAPKPLHNDLMRGRSKVVCMQEAGIMLGAKSGNADELSAYVMENYVNSAYNQFSSSRSYSSDENTLKSFRAPAMSLVLESTEESIAQALKDMNALESGYIPRQTMFKVNIKPKMNRSRTENKSYKFDDDIIEQFRALINEGCKTQVVETFTPIVVEWDDNMFDKYCDLVDHYLDDYTDDKVAKIMASRMAHKIVKLAALCAIFNNWKEGDLTLDKQSWDWAVSFGKWEMDNIDHNLSYMRSGNEFDDADAMIIDRIVAAYNHKDTGQKLRKNKIVKVATILHRCSNSIESLAQRSRMSKSDFVFRRLKSMERDGKIRIIEKSPMTANGAQCIQILEGILDAV